MSPESELDRLVRQRTRELEASNAALRQSELRFAAELDAAERLQRVATQLVTAQGIEALLEQILDAAVAIMHSDFASIQIFYPERGTNGALLLRGHRGFNAETAKSWEWVQPTSGTVCGEALRTGRRVAVPDVRNCGLVLGSDNFLRAGIRAVQATPLVSRSGALLGMVSTHWREPHELSVSELRSLDILARMAADVIERARAEDDHRKALEELQFVTENMTCGVSRCSDDLRYLWVSRKYASWLGLAPDEVAGRPILDVIGREGWERIQPHVAGVLSGKKEEYEAEVNFRGIGVRWIHAAYMPTRGSGGKVDGWVAVVTDITDLKRVWKESVFRQKLESVGTLASGIAHDFNNLLAGVLAQAEVALAELAAGLCPEEELKTIRDVAIRGSEIVRQLMIYAGKESAVVGPVDLSKTVAEMLSLLKVSVTKHVVIKADLDEGLPAIRGSAAQVRQIVMNLITNASDAIGDREGVIRVTTRRTTLKEELAAITSESLPGGDYVELKVSDTGCGMSPQTQAEVFDPFFTTKSAGRGLGLAVVHGSVQSLGGAIRLTSEPDKGTTFQVLLPCAETTGDAGGEAISNNEFAVPSYSGTLLVVEDEDPLRQALVKMLRNTGFAVFEAADGTSAIDILRATGGRIDAILLDMTIPGASVHEVVAEAANLRPDIRVILTSAYSQEAAASAMSQPQIRGFVRKPVPLAGLLRTLRSTLAP